jgi:hypothetical protein
VVIIAAGLALTAGSLIGVYDLVHGLQHIEDHLARPTAGV